MRSGASYTINENILMRWPLISSWVSPARSYLFLEGSDMETSPRQRGPWVTNGELPPMRRDEYRLPGRTCRVQAAVQSDSHGSTNPKSWSWESPVGLDTGPWTASARSVACESASFVEGWQRMRILRADRQSPRRFGGPGPDRASSARLRQRPVEVRRYGRHQVEREQRREVPERRWLSGVIDAINAEFSNSGLSSLYRSAT